MTQWILDNADALRGGSFLAVLSGFALLEAWRPRRARALRRGPRWGTHAVLLALGAAGARLVVPAGAVGAALHAQRTGVGLLDAASVPGWLAWPISLAALDLAIYAQHRAFHAVPLLWRLHALHHADRDLDASSGVRFHPGEIVVSLLWKVAVVWLLGAPAAAVVLYEALLACASVASHANLELPAGLERAARLALVTPDLHRVHHSVRLDESSSNFAAVTPLWDHLFGSFRAEPRGGQRGMRLGLLGPDELREAAGAGSEGDAEERRGSVRGESDEG